MHVLVRLFAVILATPILALGGVGLTICVGVGLFATFEESPPRVVLPIALCVLGVPSGMTAWTGWRCLRFGIGLRRQWIIPPLPAYAPHTWRSPEDAARLRGASALPRDLDLPASLRLSVLFSLLIALATAARTFA